MAESDVFGKCEVDHVAVLLARLSALEAAATDALTILEGTHSGDLDDWARIADALRAALTDEEA